ncbi:hypothetical protein ABBQ32_008531 [Trebouxia sp. C0010 RCD-2024]
MGGQHHKCTNSSPKSNTPRPGTASQKTALAGVRTPLAELNLAGSAVSNRAAFSKSTLRKASIGGNAVRSLPTTALAAAQSPSHSLPGVQCTTGAALEGVPWSVSLPLPLQPVTGAVAAPLAPRPAHPPGADLLMPAGPSGSRHSCLSPGGSSPRVSVHQARLHVPSVLTANSSSPNSNGGRSTSSHATSAANNSKRSASVTHGPMSNLADANAVAAGTVRPEGTSAQAVTVAGKARHSRGSTSQPAWISAFTCTTALHPSPGHRIFHSRQGVNPGPLPSASAGRRLAAASHAAGLSSVQSRQAIAKVGPERRGSTVAATVLSTARTGPVSRVGTTSSPAAASSSLTIIRQMLLAVFPVLRHHVSDRRSLTRLCEYASSRRTARLQRCVI